MTPKLVSACASLKRMAYARQVFDQIPEPNVTLWNSILKGYAHNESHGEVISSFGQMRSSDARPNCYTFPVVLKSCGKVLALKEGEKAHCCLIKFGFRSNPFAGTSLIEMYSGGGFTGSAYKVFGEMPLRNVVAWTFMINAFISGRDIDSARRLFDLAPERDVVLWNTMVSGYIQLGDMVAARKLFNEMPNRDVMSWNTVLHGYANNGNIEACRMFFEEMPNRNIFSWNGLIGGYARNGQYFGIIGAFKRMLSESNVTPNDVTLVMVLCACARLGALVLGKWVHVYSEGNGWKGNIFVGNALIDMYAKCGVIENAIEVFHNLLLKDLISWNTIICGLAVSGRGDRALRLFSEMRSADVKPDGVSFIGVLSACAHMGFVKDGLEYFQSMVEHYGIVPRIEHYGCLVDLLARAGLLEQAVEFVRCMPMEADDVIWTTLLGACRTYKNVEVAELVLKKLAEVEPTNPANYVMLSNIYGDRGRWMHVARVKVAMRDTGSKKLPGCSLIEIDSGVEEFYSFDERHCRSKEIYCALRGLTAQIGRAHV